MRVECAVLCDAASVRENLIHVLGGGISGTVASAFPATLQITFAFRAVLDSREAKDSHLLRVVLRNAVDDLEVASEGITFERSPGEPIVGEAALTTAMFLGSFVVPKAAQYLIDVSLDQRNIVTIPLRVEHQPSED